MNDQSLDAAERATFAEVIDEMARRNLRWPCFACRLKALSGDILGETCTHAEFIGAMIYETALRDLHATKGHTANSFNPSRGKPRGS